MSLAQEFLDAGLERRGSLEANRESCAFLQTRAIDTKGLSSEIPNIKSMQTYGRPYRVPRFDARELCEKYKDIVWAKGVHLDRVCISERGPEDIFEDEQCVGKRYRDIASVPLPGVTWEPRSFEYLRIPHRWATWATAGPQGRGYA